MPLPWDHSRRPRPERWRRRLPARCPPMAQRCIRRPPRRSGRGDAPGPTCCLTTLSLIGIRCLLVPAVEARPAVAQRLAVLVRQPAARVVLTTMVPVTGRTALFSRSSGHHASSAWPRPCAGWQQELPVAVRTLRLWRWRRRWGQLMSLGRPVPGNVSANCVPRLKSPELRQTKLQPTQLTQRPNATAFARMSRLAPTLALRQQLMQGRQA
mmetsp:Transcript_70511/g.200025  ORF Transcript_70511/g.200025 Transcript_70511/m.200025 type:complete len:211 (-) Transcript_70511:1533-2165(-)